MPGGAVNRSARPETRNPLLLLPAAQELRDSLRGQPEVRALLHALLVQLGAEAEERAQRCWEKHKAPMAVYWRAVGVYARHIARLLAA